MQQLSYGGAHPRYNTSFYPSIPQQIVCLITFNISLLITQAAYILEYPKHFV